MNYFLCFCPSNLCRKILALLAQKEQSRYSNASLWLSCCVTAVWSTSVVRHERNDCWRGFVWRCIFMWCRVIHYRLVMFYGLNNSLILYVFLIRSMLFYGSICCLQLVVATQPLCRSDHLHRSVYCTQKITFCPKSHEPCKWADH